MFRSGSRRQHVGSGVFLPFIGFDEEMQVELVHVVEDVVAVRSDQILVIVDLLLWLTKTHTNSQVPAAQRQCTPLFESRGAFDIYLSEEVGDDHVGHGVSPAADLRLDMQQIVQILVMIQAIINVCVCVHLYNRLCEDQSDL